MEDESTKAVRPLDVSPPSVPPAAPKVPIVARVIVLLTAGVLIGWLFGSMTRSDAEQIEAVSAINAPVSSTTASTTGIAEIEWQAASVLPDATDGFRPLFFSGAVELGDTLYVHIIYGNEPDFLLTRSVLWESSDGVTWKEITPDLGDDATITDIDVYENGLLLSGTADGRVQLWRSQPDRTIGPDGWNPIDLGPAPSLPLISGGFRSVTSAVNADSGVVTMAVLSLDVASQLIDPMLPPGISLSDDTYVLEPPEGATVRDRETGEIVFALDEAPEAVAHGNEVWVRIVVPEGEEQLTILELDPGARLAFDGVTDLFYIPTEKVWYSSNGVNFDLVPFGDRADSALALQPTPFRSGFVGATRSETGEVELWTSASGRQWSPLGGDVPDDCFSGFGPAVLAASGERLLLSGGNAGEVCVVDNGAWTVQSVDGHTGDRFSFVTSGAAGFVMVTGSRVGSGVAVAVSQDGQQWRAIEMPSDDSFASILVVGNRLVLFSTNDQTGGAGFSIQVGMMER